jgi:hypothetical protein
MLRIIITSILMVGAIFWGVYPPSENSPHQKIINYLGLTITADWKFHLILGIILYILAVLISQLKYIQNIWG